MSDKQSTSAESMAVCFNYWKYEGETPIACQSNQHSPGDPRPCEYEGTPNGPRYESQYSLQSYCGPANGSMPTPPPGFQVTCGEGGSLLTNPAVSSMSICDPYNIQQVFVGGQWYTQESYPGKEEGLEWLWWQDNMQIIAEFDDPYSVWERLTRAEREFIRMWPLEALKIRKNQAKAEAASQTLFPLSLRNGLGDAFRHAYFNALNARDIDNLGVVLLFASAHETETPSALSLEKNMDMFNNIIGANLGSTMNDASDQAISNAILLSLTSGELRYISPLDLTASPAHDANNDGVQDCSSCKNGIVSTSKLTPTNQ